MSTLYDPENLLAPVPPLGWNSYNAFGGMHGLPADTNPLLPGDVALEERLILETADALVSSGLRDAGYVYLNIDDRWQDPRTPRDAEGRLRHDERRFPRGMAFIGEYLHERGLKFGLYTVGNTIACGGEEGDGPNGFPQTGSLGHEFADAASFVEWGVDFLKIDWCGVDEACNRGNAPFVFEKWNRAIAEAGGQIVLSASTWGEENEAAWAPNLTHLWRTTADVHATWESIISIARATAAESWAAVAGPATGWNDPDMMHVGHPDLTLSESRTHLVLWSMLSAPLLHGNDVRTMSAEIRDLLLTPEIRLINADRSAPARFETRADEWEIWSRPLANGRVVRAVVNLANEPRELPIDLVFPGTDVFAQTHTDPDTRRVSAHGVRLTLG